MTEKFLQHIWQFGLFNKEEIKTTDGEEIGILRSGDYNTDSGPDFLNSQIKIDGMLWAGNVEVHKKASDWFKHGHDKNKAYENVILHVVLNDDKEIRRVDGEKIPCFRLNINEKLINNYNSLIKSEQKISCDKKIKDTEPFVIDFCLENMLIERLEYKTQRIIHQLDETNNDIEEVFYRNLVRNFGFGLNSDPFELLARSIPSKILIRTCENTLYTEAILFGQAGFLERDPKEVNDQYYSDLFKNYTYLKKKYSLNPLEAHIWKFLRLRPANFPTIRIAQLAGLIKNIKAIRFQLIKKSDFESLMNLFKIKVNEYWENHYLFGKKSCRRTKNLSKSTYENLIINTIVPFLFIYGKQNNLQVFIEKALEL
ncbi:DUF2851 family protein, partial [Bacteroidota bacterium]